MMDEKKNLLRLLGCIFICFILFGGFVWGADPFYHYHKPWFNIPIILNDAVYQTAGASRNLEYDSAIIGTSMTENIHTSWLDDALGWDTMKLSYSGARSNDLKAIFSLVEQKGGGLKHIIMDINDYQLTCESWTSYVERPEYLYDSYIHNDYEYLFNHDIYVRSVERYLDGLTGIEDNVDVAYVWEEDELFGKEIALNACKDFRDEHIAERTETLGEDKIYQVTGKTTDMIEEKLAVCQDNLDNILPFIDAHPETEVIILVPPYSILYWEQKVLGGELEDMLAIYEYAIEKFLQRENVSVFYFQYEPEIISNLDNYRDSAHHKPMYNRYMIDCVLENRNELNATNYKEKLTEMYEYAKSFPYETLWENE